MINQCMSSMQTIKTGEDFTPLDDVDIYHFVETIPWAKQPYRDYFAQLGIDTKGKLLLCDAYLHLADHHDNSFYTLKFPGSAQFGCREFLYHLPKYDLNDNKKQFILNCPMKRARRHRLIASAWLKHNLYGKHDFKYTQSWNIDSDMINYLSHCNKNQKLDIGEEILPARFIMWPNITVSTPPGDSEAALLFQLAFKEELFDPSVFSIVLEPAENILGCVMTEKYIYAVYGGTIPIVYGHKIYESLEKIGLDTFSDIIDTSSQHEENFEIMAVNMLEKNKHLFTDTSSLKLMDDPKIKDRLRHNLDLLRNPARFDAGCIRLSSDRSIALFKAHQELLSQHYPELMVHLT